MKKALITGITGQDGSYLAEFLLKKGYKVFGLRRRHSTFSNSIRIDHLLEEYPDHLELVYGDLTDSLSIVNAMKCRPDEVYNLAAQSHVGVSFVQPEYTAQVDAIGTLRVLEAIRVLGLESQTKLYQASTSELYGLVQETPQTETTPFYPRSPYAVAKMYSYWIVKNYREAYGIYAVNGILFNHESPRRGENFVTRKITRGLSRCFYGKDHVLELGNLDALRDWGHAIDYVEMQWLMLQQANPEDFVIATGRQVSVRQFLQYCLDRIQVQVEYQGKGVDEVGIVVRAPQESSLKIGQVLIKVNSKYFRPTEVETLLGDPAKAVKELGWKTKVTVEDLANEMIDYDMSFSK